MKGILQSTRPWVLVFLVIASSLSCTTILGTENYRFDEPHAELDGSVPDITADAAAGGAGGAAGGPPADRRDGGNGGSACDFNGTWAMLIDFRIGWSSTLLFHPGENQSLKEWYRIVRTQDGTQLRDTVSYCGLTFPDLYGQPSAGSEIWGTRFPNKMFDEHLIAPFVIEGTVSDIKPGSKYTAPTFANLFGCDLPNPTTDKWPAASALTQLDSDIDFKPGITVHSAEGDVPGSNPPRKYSNPPVDPIRRIHRQYVAARIVAALDGQVVDCDNFRGTAAVATIDGVYAINAHVLGCQEDQAPHKDCSDVDATFIDANAPIFKESPGSNFIAKRVDETYTCAKIRTLPAFGEPPPD